MPQLSKLWERQPLSSLLEKCAGSHTANTLVKKLSGVEFLPLVTTGLRMIAQLDITLLCSGIPGTTVGGTDIDNRLKTLFDALRMPHDVNEFVNEMPPLPEQKPLYVLLEDDSLIAKVSVSRMELLVSEDPGDVILFIKVVTRTTASTYDNIGL